MLQSGHPATSSHLEWLLISYPVAVPEVRFRCPPICAALGRRRSRGLGGRADVRPELLTHELVFVRTRLVVPEAADLPRSHGHAGAVVAVCGQKQDVTPQEGEPSHRCSPSLSGLALTWLVSVPVSEGDGQAVVPGVLHPTVFVSVGAQADPPHVALPREHHGEM